MTLSAKLKVTSKSQLPLLELEEITEAPLLDDKKAVFNDPNFAKNKTLPIHRWVPWIAGFSSSFVSGALNNYLKKKGTVLDPFSGVGTTLVESVLQGHDTIGFEINPYAALACRTKVNAHLADIKILYAEINKFQQFYKDNISLNSKPKSAPPQGFKTRSEFYSPQVLRKVLILQDFIETITGTELRDLFRLAFASTMVSYSNYSYEPSLGRRVSAGREEIHDFPVAKKVIDKLTEMAEDIAWAQGHGKNGQSNARIVNDSFFNCANHMESESVDMIITSPPYLNNYHYNRNTRPQLYWLGLVDSPHDLKHLENSNFGKYWQTVRDREWLGLNFSLQNADIEDRLLALRKLNTEKGAYGGNGWANYAAAYFNDCYKFAQGIQYVLKPGGAALVVIGNSILQGIMIPTDEYFGRIAESLGLTLVDINIPRATRVGSSIIQSGVRAGKAKDSHQLYEAVVVLRKS